MRKAYKGTPVAHFVQKVTNLEIVESILNLFITLTATL